MTTAARINTQRCRFDIRMAASCMEKNTTVAAEVLADEQAGDALHHNARRLVEVTELNLAATVAAYLECLKK